MNKLGMGGLEMNEIRIEKAGHWCYCFEVRPSAMFSYIVGGRGKCSYCNEELDSVYSYIIRNLRKAGLLPNDYKSICCYCQTLLKVGLISFANYSNRISYNIVIDVLTIEVNIEQHTFYFRIHDASKVLKD